LFSTLLLCLISLGLSGHHNALCPVLLHDLFVERLFHLVCHSSELRQGLSDGPGKLRQFRGAHHEQGNNKDYNELRNANTEHIASNYHKIPTGKRKIKGLTDHVKGKAARRSVSGP